MNNNINNSNNYNSITVQQETTKKAEQEISTVQQETTKKAEQEPSKKIQKKIPKKELETRINNLYKKIFISLETSLNPLLKEEDSKIFLIPNKDIKLSSILNDIKFNKNEYDGYFLKDETLDEELKLLQKVWNILSTTKRVTFLKNLEKYESQKYESNLKNLEKNESNHNSNNNDVEFIKIKELYEELENLLKFYKDNINYKENKNFNNFGETKRVYNKLIEVDNYFNKLDKSLNEIAKFTISRDLWSKEEIEEIIKKERNNEKNEGNKNEKIKIYGNHKIMKKDKVVMTFLDVYMKLKKNRGIFRKLLDYVKDLNYLENIIEKEKKFLKYIFSYLENIVRILNINNNYMYNGNLNLSIFNLNNEFYNSYSSGDLESYIVKFKYVVHDVIKNFYEVEIENMENRIGKKIEKLDEVEYVRNEKKEEKLIKAFEDLYKENNAYYEFISNLVFDAINTEMLNLNIFKNFCKVNCKYEMQKFYNLQNMFGTLFKDSRDFIKNLIKFYHVKYYESIIYFLKNEKAMLHKIYDFIMSYVPNLKDKENFIKANFKKFSKDEKQEIKNNFKEVFLKEIERYTDKIIIRNDFEDLDKFYPAIHEKFYKDAGEEHAENFDLNTNFAYDSVKIEDINFNSVFNKINSLVDEYGNLKQNDIKDEEAVKDDSFLGKLYKLLNEIVEFYFNEKNGKFYFYETFNRLSE